MAETSRSEDAHTVLAATPARQGRFGRHMFWVLVLGTVLAAIGLFLAWTWKAPALNHADADLAGVKAQASSYSTPQAASPAPVQTPAADRAP